MDNQELEKEINTIKEKLDQIYKSSEKTRKYFLAFLIITALSLLLPVLGLLFAIPKFLSLYANLI